jgi:hypothetical protein
MKKSGKKTNKQGKSVGPNFGSTSFPVQNVSDIFSSVASSNNIEKMYQQPAIPVFVTNKEIPTDTGKMIKTLLKALLMIIPGGALLSKFIDGGSDDDFLSSMTPFATGGYGKANSKVSHFISGDSLNTRPNPEQVSID